MTATNHSAVVGIADYHVHTRFSDGTGEPAACVERAIELGLPELGFADHLTPPYLGADGYYGIDQGRLEDYVEAVRKVAGAYPEMTVLLGIEADYVPEAAEETLTLLAAHQFDYVLCAVHFVDGFGFIERYRREADGWLDAGPVFRRYFETVREAALTGAFDVVAHLDLPKKWGHRPVADLADVEDAALAAISTAGMAIEINTSGLDRYAVAEMFPAPQLLERACGAGIPVTFGSDAHRVEEVASCFSEALTLAKRGGYDSYLRLSDRRQVALP
jgi:histidinol-phosphatase (PHP family)